MMEKPYTPGFQLLILFGLTFLFQIIAQVVFQFVFANYQNNAEVENDTWVFLGGGLILQLFTHLLAFFAFLRITGLSFSAVIDHQKLDWKKLMVLPIVVVAAILTVSFFTFISSAIFESLEAFNYLDDEKANQQKIQALLTHKDPLLLIYSIFVVGVVTAIGEELIYRGILIKKLFEATYNKHFAIVISGLIFAAMHGHPVQIMPIAVMGIVFGYIYLYTRNIWYTVIIHFLFNTIQIIGVYFWPETMA